MGRAPSLQRWYAQRLSVQGALSFPPRPPYSFHQPSLVYFPHRGMTVWHPVYCTHTGFYLWSFPLLSVAPRGSRFWLFLFSSVFSVQGRSWYTAGAQYIFFNEWMKFHFLYSRGNGGGLKRRRKAEGSKPILYDHWLACLSPQVSFFSYIKRIHATKSNFKTACLVLYFGHLTGDESNRSNLWLAQERVVANTWLTPWSVQFIIPNGYGLKCTTALRCKWFYKMDIPLGKQLDDLRRFNVSPCSLDKMCFMY